MTDWSRLARALRGALLLPDDPAYDDARRPSIGRFLDVRPQAVARCATPADVAAALETATQAGLPVAIRSGGHSFAGLSSTEGLLLDLGPMDEIRVLGDTVRVGAGVQLGRQLYPALAAHGRTVAGGCGTTVGVSGLVLGGGIGLLGRQHGFSCDSLVAADVVLASGELVHCDDTTHPDLFWALRGAGAGGFGVVTSLVLRTVPEPATTTFHASWPVDTAGALLDSWQRWAPAAPRELACSLLVDVPAGPDADPLVVTLGAMTAAEGDLRAALDDLARRAGARPVDVRVRHAPYADAKRLLESPDRGAEVLSFVSSDLLDAPLPADAVDGLVEHLVADRVPGQSRQLDLSPLAGAYNDPAPDATAFVHRGQRVLLKQETTVARSAPDLAAAAQDWLAASVSRVATHGTGRSYPNFPDTALRDPLRAYYGANLPRLRRVKSAYDPTDVLRHAQSVPLSGRRRPPSDAGGGT